MSIVALLIGLGPLIGWGFFPTVASKFGGKPVHQIIGATVGTLIFAIILAVVTSSGSLLEPICYSPYYQVQDGDSDKSLHLKRSN